MEDWNGNTTAFGYDPDGNLTTETLPAAGAGVVEDTFTYNAADQMTQIQDGRAGRPCSRPTSSTRAAR